MAKTNSPTTPIEEPTNEIRKNWQEEAQEHGWWAPEDLDVALAEVQRQRDIAQRDNVQKAVESGKLRRELNVQKNTAQMLATQLQAIQSTQSLDDVNVAEPEGELEEEIQSDTPPLKEPI